MNLLEEIPEGLDSIALLANVDGYLEIFSVYDDDTLVSLLEMAIQMITSKEFSVEGKKLH
jgi:hypothetical protein